MAASVDRAARRRILRAVQGGRAVSNPADAGFAAALARDIARSASARGGRRQRAAGIVAVAVLVGHVVWAVSGTASLGAAAAAAVVPAALLVLHVARSLRDRRLRRRAADAERLNAQLAESFGIAIPDRIEGAATQRVPPLPWPLAKRPRPAELLLLFSMLSLSVVGLVPERGGVGPAVSVLIVLVGTLAASAAAVAVLLGLRRRRAATDWRARGSGAVEAAVGVVLAGLWLVLVVAVAGGWA